MTAGEKERARRLIAGASHICVLTGAGISAESGLRTFRDNDGLWENHPVAAVATPEGFAEDPKLVWNFYNARRKSAHSALPNAGHHALARLDRHRHCTILTQNVDGLHQLAHSKHVIELHGSIWKVRCTRCGHLSTDHPMELPILPYCGLCKGLLRPNIVWFGEMLDLEVLEQAETAVEECDLFLVVGTSGLVQPAASYPWTASRRGVAVIEINLEATPISDFCDLSLYGKAGEILPQLIPGDHAS